MKRPHWPEDAASDEKGGARSITGLECLYGVVASVDCASGKLRAQACDRATELDLQRNPRQRLDERGISGLLGDILVKIAIAHGISFCISALQGGRGFNKYIIKPQDVVVTHLRHSEFDRKTLKPLE